MKYFKNKRKQDDGDKLKKESPSIIPIIADVTNETQIDNAAKEINKTLQSKKLQLIALVNNAGYAESSILEFIPLDRLRQQFEGLYSILFYLFHFKINNK